MLRTPLLVALGAVLALTACGGTSTASDAGPSTTSSADALTTSTTSLGTVVVGADGRTVYRYDDDSKDATSSACSGPCLSAWPPVEVSGTPHVTGVTGHVGTIAAPDGGRQLTLDGWPLYYDAEDSAPGDVAGQGEGGVWWAVAPDGSEVKSAGAPSTAAGGGDDW